MAPVSVLVNGSSGPRFSMKCGLRQGYPLSPFLFNLVVDDFTILINQFQEIGWLGGIPVFGLSERVPIL